jgi:hypothetical protein
MKDNLVLRDQAINCQQLVQRVADHRGENEPRERRAEPVSTLPQKPEYQTFGEWKMEKPVEQPFHENPRNGG